MIPLGKPEISDEDINAIVDVLRSGNIATGDIVNKFEEELSKFIGKRYAIAVNSGTVALYLTIKLMNLKNIIIPTITCPAVLNAVLNGGAKPIFLDVDRETHNLNPEKLTSNTIKEADGLIITNTYGHPAKIDEIKEICLSNDILFIEDFAQSNGAWYKDKRCGSFGDVSITSFYGPKTMTTGHGGMILTNSKEFCYKSKITRGDDTYEYSDSIIPLNFKMTDFQAALGINQLKRLDDFVKKRRHIAKQYNEKLGDISQVGIIKEHKDVTHSYYKYVLLLERINKILFIEQMKKKRVQVGMLYDPPLHKMKVVKELLRINISLPIAEKIAQTSVSLPMYPAMSQNDVEEVINSVKRVIGE
jgi:dTDP-4-amino-4,6-dideoxygalactose transaminase